MDNSSKIKKINKVLLNFVAIIVTLSVLIPLLLIVYTSFKGGIDAKSLSFSIPEEWDFSNFSTVIKKGKLGTAFVNSLLYSAVGSFITVLFSSSAAYYFSRRKSKISEMFYLLIVLGIVLPVNYVTLMKVMQILHLNNTRIGIIFLYISAQTPFLVFLIYGFVSKIPREIDEAAVIDGCGPIKLFFYVIFPLLKPILITAFVLCFLNMWNEFIMPLYFLNATEKWPMTLAVYNFFGQFGYQWQYICADVLLTSLPVVILYLICQKQIVGGQTAGSVKG